MASLQEISVQYSLIKLAAISQNLSALRFFNTPSLDIFVYFMTKYFREYFWEEYSSFLMPQCIIKYHRMLILVVHLETCVGLNCVPFTF